MSRCDELRAALLEAEPAELAGQGTGPLARHLRTCTGCAARARLLLEAAERLDEHLGTAPGVDAAAVVARARTDGGHEPVAPTGGERRLGTGARGRWTGLAAAAAIAALLVLGRREAPPPGAQSTSFREGFAVVEAPADRNVAVIETDNPDITVLWFF